MSVILAGGYGWSEATIILTGDQESVRVHGGGRGRRVRNRKTRSLVVVGSALTCQCPLYASRHPQLQRQRRGAELRSADPTSDAMILARLLLFTLYVCDECSCESCSRSFLTYPRSKMFFLVAQVPGHSADGRYTGVILKVSLYL